MEEFDTNFIAGVQKSNYLDIHERYPVQVQRNPGLIAFCLPLQFIEMLRSQPADQPNKRLSPIGILFNLQCHLRFL